MPSAVLSAASISFLCSVGLFYGVGVGPVCFALIGELFPPKAKATCASLICAFR